MKKDPLNSAHTRFVLALALFFALMAAPILMIRSEQSQLINESANTRASSITWQVIELEREHSKLLRMLERAVADESDAYFAALRQQQERYADELAQVMAHPRREFIEHAPSFSKTKRDLSEVVTQSAALLTITGDWVAHRAAARDIADQLGELEPQLAEMALHAAQATSLQLEERIRAQGRSLLLLTAIQIALLIALVTLLVRHIQRQTEQYNQLKRLSGALDTARQEAERSSQAQALFLANMSHEIRTPFQGLLGMLHLLNTTSLNSEQKDHLATSLDSAHHLLDVLNGILDIASMDSGGLKLTKTSFDLHELARSTQEMMRPLAAEKSIDFHLTLGERVPQWVQGDALRLRQILFNLIGNAIKFTDRGEVSVHVDTDVNDTRHVVIQVEDTGVGMDEATLELLFTRFYQADGSFQRKKGGTGLGLEISRNLARLMGGDITASSKPGQGTVFTVRLNLPEGTPPETPAEDTPTVTSRRRLRLLVAEDHPINLKYMSLLLEKMGHEAVFCVSGREALDLLQRQSFDAVLLDYHMPDLDGISTAKEIRSLDGSASNVPILLVTADVMGEVKRLAAEAGIDRFVSKPLTMPDLQRALFDCDLLTDHTSPVTSPQSTELTHEPERPLTQDQILNLTTYQQLVPFTSKEVRAEMASMVLAQTTGSLSTLITALSVGDYTEIETAAHNLKGTAMLLGLSHLAHVSGEIERATTESIQEGVSQWKLTLEDLRERSIEAIQAVEALMEDFPAPAS